MVLFEVCNFFKNTQNSWCSTYKTYLRMLNIPLIERAHYHPKILQNFVRLKYAFFEEWPNFYTINVHNFFKECSKLYAFNKLHYSKNLHNFVLPKYTIFKWVYTILHLQQMIFLEECTLLIFNIHNISTNVQKSINSTYTIFKECLKLCAFKEH